jgi:mono/diheme cytochrome c family protein
MRIPRLVIAVVVLGTVTLAAYAASTFGGFSTRSSPTVIEQGVARAARRMAIPAKAQRAANPVPFSPEVWAQSRAHFADHCANCHANDGSGQTELGQNLYPKAPDMRLAVTQDLTDGELYWIIENGIRLSGMPAWGTGGDNDTDTWMLVHFIRHLKELTPEQISAMAALNPRTRAEFEEEREDEQFLAGGDVQAGAHAGHAH